MEEYANLTIQQIRSRLSERNIEIPPHLSRKQDLINLLVDNLRNQPRSEAPAQRKRSITPIRNENQINPQQIFRTEPRSFVSDPVSPQKKVGQIPYNPISTQLPNQKTDVFRARMEAAFSQPEIEELEMQSSGSKQLKESLSQILTFLVILLVIGFLTYEVKMWMAAPVFCGKGIEQNCMPCPDNAICEHGVMTCKEAYVRDRNVCVEDKSILSEAYKNLWELENYVIEQSIAKYLEDRTRYAISFNGYIENHTISNSNVKDKLIDLIRRNISQKIQADENYNSGLTIYAKEPFLSIYAQLIVYWQNHKNLIVVGALFLLYLLFKYISYRQRSILQDKAMKMYELIRNQIQSNIDDTLEHGVWEVAIKSDIEKQLGQRLTRRLWPIIEDLRRKDKNVCKFETIIAGRPKILWQWKDEAKPMVGGKMKYL